jgi:hypothetical protein
MKEARKKWVLSDGHFSERGYRRSRGAWCHEESSHPTGKILVPFPHLHVGISSETSMCFEPIVNTTHWRAPVARGDKISHEARGGVRCGGFIKTISPASSQSARGDL